MPEAEEMVDLPTEGASVTVNIPEEKVIVQPDLFSQPEGEGSVETSMEADSEEHEEYSKNVQKRINKMTKKLREAERQQSAAIEYAKNVQQENNALRGKVQSLDEGYVAEYGDRIATQNESLTKDLEEAIATNDSAAQVDLNKKLAQLAIEEERVRAAKAVQEQNQNASAQQAAYQQQLAWFGKDEAMTFAAFGIHKRLVEQEHFDTTSKEYYDTLDNEIRNAFPHKFTGGEVVSVSEGRRPQQAVASATRSSNSGRKSSVRLSPSEVVIARKLGVPLEEYARHKRYV